MKNLILLGFMGSGKSTIGRLVATELHMNFVDMDRKIEEQAGKSITEIFETLGENGFRVYESDLAMKLAAEQNQVIATGGGMVLREQNIENLSKTGVLIHLRVDAQTAFSRTRAHSHRPLLHAPDPEEKIRELFKMREALYNKITNSVDTVNRSPHEIAHAVIRIYRSHAAE
jgi:shikimate kinase